MQKVVEKGLIVRDTYVPLKPLEELGTQVVLSTMPPYKPNWVLVIFLQGLGRVLSPVLTFLLGFWDPRFCHILCFCHQLTIQLMAGGVLQPHPLYIRGSEVLLVLGTRAPPIP